VGLAVVNPLAKLKQCSFIHSRNIEGGLKFLKGSRDRDHAPLSEIFFTPALNPAILDPFAKFEERSFVHSRNIKGV